MKRLRKAFGKTKKERKKIRSYGCAEYGKKHGRPHYHICVFGIDFDDKKLYSKRGGFDLWESEKLAKLWKNGNATIGEVNFETAAYVARYITKKINGKKEEKHYEYIDKKTGEILKRPPERAVCISRRPGIGMNWFKENEKYTTDHDWVIVRGKKMKPPKYYDYLYEKKEEEKMKEIKKKRKEKGIKQNEIIEQENEKNYKKYKWKNGTTPPKARINILEEIQEIKYSQLKRGYENENS